MKYAPAIGSLLIAGALCLTTGIQPAQAVTTDTLLTSTSLGSSGDEAELQAIADAAGVDVSLLTLVDKQDVTSADVMTNGSQYWLDVNPLEPAYFLLKFGTGGTTADSDYIFENIAELFELVWTNAQVQGLMDNFGEGDGRLSHYTLAGGTSTVIPLPATLPLFLTGLLGMGFLARRRRQMAEA